MQIFIQITRNISLIFLGKEKYSKRIADVLIKMRTFNLISENNFEFLNIKNPREATFYLLPKIHKKDIPCRPICSSINHPTSNISKFVHEHIEKYVPRTNSYVRDTQHFISRFKQLDQIPEGFYLFIWGFTSFSTLYRSYHDG